MPTVPIPTSTHAAPDDSFLLSAIQHHDFGEHKSVVGCYSASHPTNQVMDTILHQHNLSYSLHLRP